MADIFVLWSLKEGFGLVYIEALRAGLPVLAHDFPVSREVLQSEGIFADFRNEGRVGRWWHSLAIRRIGTERVQSRILQENTSGATAASSQKTRKTLTKLIESASNNAELLSDQAAQRRRDFVRNTYSWSVLKKRYAQMLTGPIYRSRENLLHRELLRIRRRDRNCCDWSLGVRQ
jgi:glycosyltransferase involved in cell wall biosynthesis